MRKTLRQIVEKPKIKVDFGCGKHKREGFYGVDCLEFPGVDQVFDIGKQRFPWKDNSIAEAHASHFIEHLDATERIHFVNELYRVLAPDAACTVIVPHWASMRAYGDLTHKWPPVSEFWFYYLDKNWRKDNAPHNDFYTCDFVVTWGYNMHNSIMSRNQEYQQNALQFWKEAAQDTIATFKKRV